MTVAIMPDNVETMVRIPVFRFEVFDRLTRAWTLAPYFATQHHIDAYGGVALPGTRRMVAPAEVDATGIHREPVPEG